MSISSSSFFSGEKSFAVLPLAPCSIAQIPIRLIPSGVSAAQRAKVAIEIDNIVFVNNDHISMKFKSQ